MDLWFTEAIDDIRAAWRIKEVLYHRRSQFQDVAIIDTVHFGRMLVLDGCVMTTEQDEFVYHEMIAHPGLLAHPNPRSVCVVGGGDGGTVREVLKHSTVERVVLAEIDADVIDVSRRFLPALAGSLDDPRVEIVVGDGVDYVRRHPGAFDVILSDSTDPIGPGVVLFENPYFAAVRNGLREDGIFVSQCESLWLHRGTVKRIAERMEAYFSLVLPFVATIPTYPTGSWSFLIATQGRDPRIAVDAARQAEVAATTRYYTPDHQRGAFAVPRFYHVD